MKNPFIESKIVEIRDKAEVLRGRIIDVAITIEFFLSETIIEYFSKENVKDDFCKYILKESFGFNDKKHIFKELYNSRKLNDSNFYDEIISDLTYIQSIRNKVAHSNLYLNPTYVNNYDNNQTKFTVVDGKHYGKIFTINHKMTKENHNEFLYSFPVFIATAERLFTAFKYPNIKDKETISTT